MRAASSLYGSNRGATSGVATAKSPPWGQHTRRTPLVAAGFLAGALLGALPPMQALSARMSCTASGGEWIAEVGACELRAQRRLLVPAQPAYREHELLQDDGR